MSSNSELSDVPLDDTIEETLREIIRQSKVDPITINTVRTAAEEQLGLAPGFFKTHDEWKGRSKTIINDAFNEPSSQRSPSPAPIPSKPITKRTTNASTKRSSTDNAGKSRKRQKQATTDSGDSVEETLEDEESDIADTEAAKKPAARPKQRSKKQPAPAEDSEAEDPDERVVDKSDREESEPEKPEDGSKAEDGSESEMSVVLDEAPPKQRRRKSASTDSKPKAKAKVTKGSKGAKASASASKDMSPDEAEIKRLQGWLVKCGIRKLWHRELAPYDTTKAKIKHLKEMLKDAGMDGRYSVEKARAIKEQRELAADLEAVKEGAKIWGNEQEEGESSEEDASSKPRRRAAASRFVDFGDEDDEDE